MPTKAAQSSSPEAAAVPAAHEPSDPAPQYANYAEGLVAPRTPNFNVRASSHNPYMSTRPALDDTAIDHVDRHMRDRWGAMLSIDDVVAGLVATLEEEGVLDNTYVLFSSGT